jgi:hypothetical protein
MRDYVMLCIIEIPPGDRAEAGHLIASAAHPISGWSTPQNPTGAVAAPE